MVLGVYSLLFSWWADSQWQQAERCTFATTLSALLGWSPKKGMPTMGFPWYMACIKYEC